MSRIEIPGSIGVRGPGGRVGARNEAICSRRHPKCTSPRRTTNEFPGGATLTHGSGATPFAEPRVESTSRTVLKLLGTERAAPALGGDLDTVVAQLRGRARRPPGRTSRARRRRRHATLRSRPGARARSPRPVRADRSTSDRGRTSTACGSRRARGTTTRGSPSSRTELREVDRLQQRFGDREDRDFVVDAEGERLGTAHAREVIEANDDRYRARDPTLTAQGSRDDRRLWSSPPR